MSRDNDEEVTCRVERVKKGTVSVEQGRIEEIIRM
jgi:hypothetical protein